MQIESSWCMGGAITWTLELFQTANGSAKHRLEIVCRKACVREENTICFEIILKFVAAHLIDQEIQSIKQI